MAVEGGAPRQAGTGVAGLDDVLAGGLAPGHVFLLEGSPGTGRTTVALSFLMAGAAAGERGLYITLSETEAELRAGAASHARVALRGRRRQYQARAQLEELAEGERRLSTALTV